MKIDREYLKKYIFLALVLLTYAVLFFFAPEIGKPAFDIGLTNIKTILTFLPAIFFLLGLLDAWLERKHMIKYMGDNSGMRGHCIALFLGAFSAGPLYIAFPIAFTFLKKGASFMNIFLFLGAWSTLKIPMLSFEAASLGFRYTFIRLICNIIGIYIISWLLNKILSPLDREKVMEKDL